MAKKHKSKAKGDRLEHVQVVSTGAKDVWHCEKCHKSSPVVYKAQSPFAPMVEIVGCPNCGSINTMIAGCVGCGGVAEGMKDGVWYCLDHMPEEQNDES